jgi:hypothetical protein
MGIGSSIVPILVISSAFMSNTSTPSSLPRSSNRSRPVACSSLVVSDARFMLWIYGPGETEEMIRKTVNREGISSCFLCTRHDSSQIPVSCAAWPLVLPLPHSPPCLSAISGTLLQPFFLPLGHYSHFFPNQGFLLSYRQESPFQWL